MGPLHRSESILGRGLKPHLILGPSAMPLRGFFALIVPIWIDAAQGFYLTILDALLKTRNCLLDTMTYSRQLSTPVWSILGAPTISAAIGSKSETILG